MVSSFKDNQLGARADTDAAVAAVDGDTWNLAPGHSERNLEAG